MINIIVALDCEAKPLIEYFKLKRQPDHAYPVYRTDKIQLIVSGVGKLNAATATGYLAGVNDTPAAWVNIGIAGHKTHVLGTPCLTHKITDQQSNQSWYPIFIFKTTLATESLGTFDAPENNYEDELLHDMEATGFYQAASRFNSAEFIHCLKVVSDNAENSSREINKQMVSELIHEQIDPIANFISSLDTHLDNWNNITATPDIYNAIIKACHFSTYQQHQLKQLLKRWTALRSEQNNLSANLLRLNNSRDILKYLQDALNITE